nr:hypothetical protein [Acidipropionibacterium thoenii]
MTDTLNDKKILILSTNYGTETSELTSPLRYLKEHGAQVTVAAPSTDPIATLEGDKDPGEKVTPTPPCPMSGWPTTTPSWSPAAPSTPTPCGPTPTPRRW